MTIYGQFDAGVYNISGYTAGKSATVYGDGATFSNVIGFRGSEDLGGGLRGVFQLETDVQTNNGGMNQNGLFRRQANVGAAGGFGEVKFGVTGNLLIATNGLLAPVGGNSIMTATSSALGYADFYTRNAVTYTSPSFNGLVAAVQYGFANTVNDVAGGDVKSGSLAYTSGNLQLRGAMQQRKGISATGNASASNPSASANATTTTAWPAFSGQGANQSLDKTSYVIGARYKVGAVELGGAYLSNEMSLPGTATTKITGYLLGAGYTTGAWTLGANYVSSEKSSLTNLQARYALSKRTNIIATGGIANNDSTVAFAPLAFNTGTGYAAINDSTLGTLGNRGTGRNITGFGVGLTHSF